MGLRRARGKARSEPPRHPLSAGARRGQSSSLGAPFSSYSVQANSIPPPISWPSIPGLELRGVQGNRLYSGRGVGRRVWQSSSSSSETRAVQRSWRLQACGLAPKASSRFGWVSDSVGAGAGSAQEFRRRVGGEIPAQGRRFGWVREEFRRRVGGDSCSPRFFVGEIRGFPFPAGRSFSGRFEID